MCSKNHAKQIAKKIQCMSASELDDETNKAAINEKMTHDRVLFMEKLKNAVDLTDFISLIEQDQKNIFWKNKLVCLLDKLKLNPHIGSILFDKNKTCIDNNITFDKNILSLKSCSINLKTIFSLFVHYPEKTGKLLINSEKNGQYKKNLEEVFSIFLVNEIYTFETNFISRVCWFLYKITKCGVNPATYYISYR